jgi:hypothetical protein
VAIKYQYANAQKTAVYVHDTVAPPSGATPWNAVMDQPHDAYGNAMRLWVSLGRPQPAPYDPQSQ